MLLSQNKPKSEQTISTIVETLAEKVYAHGHAIGLRTAKEIALPALAAEAELDELLWRLFEEYEADLKLGEPLDPVQVVQQEENYVEDAAIAIIESADASHAFTGQINVKMTRQMPPTLNVSVNLNLQLPSALAAQLRSGAPQGLQQVLQEFVQQAQQAALKQAQEAVQEALRKQAPGKGLEVAFRGGPWHLVVE